MFKSESIKIMLLKRQMTFANFSWDAKKSRNLRWRSRYSMISNGPQNVYEKLWLIKTPVISRQMVFFFFVLLSKKNVTSSPTANSASKSIIKIFQQVMESRVNSMQFSHFLNYSHGGLGRVLNGVKRQIQITLEKKATQSVTGWCKTLQNVRCQMIPKPLILSVH